MLTAVDQGDTQDNGARRYPAGKEILG